MREWGPDRGSLRRAGCHLGSALFTQALSGLPGPLQLPSGAFGEDHRPQLEGDCFQKAVRLETAFRDLNEAMRSNKGLLRGCCGWGWRPSCVPDTQQFVGTYCMASLRGCPDEPHSTGGKTRLRKAGRFPQDPTTEEDLWASCAERV